jgi:hypothetical protein
MALIDRIAKMIPSDSSTTRTALVVPGSLADLPKAKPFNELGVSGLLRTRGVGYVYEEWLRDLSTARAKQIYREMRDNDAVIGSMFFALEMILRRAEWRIEPAKTRKGEKIAEFVEQCMQDMSHTWEDFIAECVNMFAFGFALFETVYKRRKGPDGRQSSRYDDGLIGWRKFAPRAQESILYWIWDDAGGLQGCVQLAAPDYHSVPLPIEKLLLFRTTSLKNNPEGRSILRNCYRPWFFKRRAEEVESIGVERDLCGIPVLYISGEALDAMEGGTDAARKLVRDIKIDDQAGVVLPQAFDEKGNKHVELQLLRAAGSKQLDAGATIQRYNTDMLNTILAGFVQFGQTPTGSRALHVSATQIFSLAIGAFMDSVAAVMNRIAIPRLMALNNMDLKDAPQLKAGEIGVRDLDELASFVSKLAATGMTFFDRDTANYLRKIGRLPEQPEDDEAGPAQPPMPPGAQPQGQPPVPGRPPFPGQPASQQTAPPKDQKPTKPAPEDSAEEEERLENAT